MSSRRLRLTIGASSLLTLIAAGIWLTPAESRSLASPAPIQQPALYPAQCPPVTGPRWVFPTSVKISSVKYEAFSLNYSCSKAAAVIDKVAATTLHNPTPGVEQSIKAVDGFACIAFPDKNGHPYAGSCRHGNSAFGWNWNVIYINKAQTTTGVTVSVWSWASEYSSNLTSLGGNKYQLAVGDASGIGTINSFKWTPPNGLKITSISQTTGAKCALQPDNTISCQGSLAPPKCLCKGVGGSVTIDFSGTLPKPAELNGHPVIHPLVGANVQITSMTPVPYLVPSTPQEQRDQHGV